MSAISEHEVLIAGGGLAGATLAGGLALQGRKVAVIEAVARSANHQPSYDDRTLALNAASLNILANLGIDIDTLEHCSIRRIEITRAGGFGHLVLEARDHRVERFGAVVLARELGNRLLECLARNEEITEYCPDTVEAFRIEDDRVRVRLGSGQVLSGRLLVAADGTGSMVRQQAGIQSSLRDYGQSAMIFNVRPGACRPDTAWERFTPQGPLALLPQPEGRLGVVWIDRTEAIEEALGWEADLLIRRLETRAGPGFGGFAQPGKRARYPLKLLRTPVPAGERVVAVGNAANTLHPVSAQGFNLGLRDVAALLEALEDRADPGAPDLLARYAKMRQADQEQTVRYTDTLARAFTHPASLVRLGTAAGLAAHAFFPALQRRLVQAAMGYRGAVPPLARPRS